MVIIGVMNPASNEECEFVEYPLVVNSAFNDDGEFHTYYTPWMPMVAYGFPVGIKRSSIISRAVVSRAGLESYLGTLKTLIETISGNQVSDLEEWDTEGVVPS